MNPIAVKRLAPVLPVPSRKDMRVPFTSCADMLRHDGDRNTPLWQLAVEYERARGNFTEREVIDKMIDIVRILRRSIASGIAGTSYEDRVLGHQSGRFAEMMNAGRLLDGGALEPHHPLRHRPDGGEEQHGRHRRRADGGRLRRAARRGDRAWPRRWARTRRKWRKPCSPPD